MLSIGKIGGGQGDERYYIDAVAKGQEDYYAGRGEAEGEWLGKATGWLDLDGRVGEDEFISLLHGRKSQLKDVEANRTARSIRGFDLTFSAPKSVSILYGVGGADVSAAVREAHDDAVRQALGYLEREACWTRRRREGGIQRLRGDGFAVAAFRHRSSRAGDPQLHTHAVVANVVRAEGRWSALDGRALYAHARTAGFLYQAALRDQLSDRLGVRWPPGERGVGEVRGMPQSVLRHFSRRSEEIRARMAERGGRTARSAQAAALETRRGKDYGVAPERLRGGGEGG